MNRTAYIHIGMPKAGSTALQMALSEARLPLSKNGILYPGDSVDHAVLCAQFHPQGEKHFYLKRKNIMDSKLQCNSILREIQGFSGDIILSSEYLCSIGAIKSSELKTILNNIGFDVKFVIYIRHPVDSAISETQQKIKNKNTGENLFDLIRNPKWISFKTAIDPIFSTLGRESIIVRNFHNAKRGGIARDLIGMMGYASLSRSLPNVRTNESLSMDGVLMADIHNNYKEKFAVDLFPKGLIFKIGGKKFNFPEEVKKRIREASASDLQWLKNNFAMELQEEAPSQAIHFQLSDELCERLMYGKPAKNDSTIWSTKRWWKRAISRVLRKNIRA